MSQGYNPQGGNPQGFNPRGGNPQSYNHPNVSPQGFNPQSGRPQGGNYPRPYVQSPMVWSILTTLFCCLPLGIVSIVYASSVNSLLAAGAYNEAQDAAGKARTWAWVAFGAGLICQVLPLLFYFFIILLSILAAAAESGGAY